MSGLLRRLAGQAMGLGSPVRTASHLPFAPRLELVEDGALTDTLLDPGPFLIAPTGPKESREVELQRAAAEDRPAKPLVLAAAQTGKPPDETPVAASRAANTAFGIPPTRLPGDVPDSTPRRGAQTTPIVAQAPSVAGRRSARGVLAALIEGEEHRRFLLPAVVSQPLAAQTLGSAPSTRAGARVGTRLAGAACLESRVVGPWGAVEEVTEVHVNIGRIEVTAVHEAPRAPERRPPVQRKAMSLDEYLARRQGSRS